MPLFNRDDKTADAAPTAPGIPLPPIGGDRWAWVRWGVTVLLLLAGLWLGGGQAKQLGEQAGEIKALKAEIQARPVSVTAK